MRVLVIAPPYKDRGNFYELPLGMAYISSYLKSKKVDVLFINMNEYDLQDEDVRSSDVVLIGGLSVHYRIIKDVLRYVKGIHPGIVSIVGGGAFSSLPDIMFEMLSPYIDIGVIGEGEISTYNILLDLPTALSTRIVNAEPIKDLDSLPFPDYEGLGISKYLDRQLTGDEHYLYPMDNPRCIPLISSRSCPHNCSFCFHPTGRVYRQRSLDNVFLEIDYLVDRYKINMLSLLDELFSQFPDRIGAFCERIKGYNLKWMTQMRVDSVDQNTIRMLKDAGCFQISYGIEHVNEKILAGYNKRTTLPQIIDTLRMTYEAGIGIQGNILLGGPHESDITARQAISWREANLRYMINLSAVIPYPGTDLFKYGVSTGKISPREFIERGCPYVNFSNTDLRLPISMLWGKVVSSDIMHNDPVRGEVKRVSVVCPHCSVVSTYSGLYWGSTGVSFTQGNSYRIGCRSCNQRFDIKI